MVSDYCGNIYWGRPEWNLLFRNKRVLIETDKEEEVVDKVGVFVCGNYELSRDVYVACRDNSGSNLTFDFHMENF